MLSRQPRTLFGSTAARSIRPTQRIRRQHVEQSRRPASTVPSFLADAAAKHKFRDSLVCRSEELQWTFEEVRNWVDAFAVGWNDGRLLPGHKLVSHVGNGVAAIVTSLAVPTAGATYVAVPDSASLEQFVKVVQSENPRAFLVEYRRGNSVVPEELSKHFDGLDNLGFSAPLYEQSAPNLKFVAHTGHTNVNGFRMASTLPVFDPLPSPLAKVQLSGNDIARREYDASCSQATETTHEAIINAGVKLGTAAELDESDRVFTLLDLSTTAGLSASVFATGSVGAALHLPVARGSSADALRSMHDEQSSVVFLSTSDKAFVTDLCEKASAFDLSHLRSAVLVGDASASGALKSALGLERVFNAQVGADLTVSIA